MNHGETSLLRKIFFLSNVILAAVYSVTSARRAVAQVTTAHFDAVDNYIRTRMQQLGIPSAALAIIQGGQIVYL